MFTTRMSIRYIAYELATNATESLKTKSLRGGNFHNRFLLEFGCLLS